MRQLTLIDAEGAAKTKAATDAMARWHVMCPACEGTGRAEKPWWCGWRMTWWHEWVCWLCLGEGDVQQTIADSFERRGRMKPKGVNDVRTPWVLSK